MISNPFSLYSGVNIMDCVDIPTSENNSGSTGNHQEFQTSNHSPVNDYFSTITAQGGNSASNGVFNLSFSCSPPTVNPVPNESFSYSRPRGAARSLFSEESYEIPKFGEGRRIEESTYSPAPSSNLAYSTIHRSSESSIQRSPLEESFMGNTSYLSINPTELPQYDNSVPGEKYHQLMSMASSLNPTIECQQFIPRPSFLEQTPHFMMNDIYQPLLDSRPRHSEIHPSTFGQEIAAKNWGLSNNEKNVFDCPTIWGPPENIRTCERFDSRLNTQEIQRFGPRSSRGQTGRKTSSSASVSDEELDKIYKSYLWSGNIECVPVIQEDPRSLNARPNEYATPKKQRKENIQKDLRANEKKNKSRQQFNGKPLKGGGCQFCISNGEMSQFCYNHKLKDEEGNIVCPVLSRYTCPNCGATGVKAHTKRHCPLYEPMTSSRIKKGFVSRRNAAGHIVITKV